MKKITPLLGSALFIASLSAQALEVAFQDPKPGIGISYEWEVHLDQNETATLTGSVGGKSSYEPDFSPPDIGWTHTSNWVALMIHQPSMVTFKVMRQSGVVRTSVSREDGSVSYSVAGSELYPGLSIYSGWDDTSETEKGSFNSIGNFWSTIQWIESEGDTEGMGTGMVTHTMMLGAGLYSVNIGGVNALHCATDAPCFNGRHGYKATISTQAVPTSYGDMAAGMSM